MSCWFLWQTLQAVQQCSYNLPIFICSFVQVLIFLPMVIYLKRETFCQSHWLNFSRLRQHANSIQNQAQEGHGIHIWTVRHEEVIGDGGHLGKVSWLLKRHMEEMGLFQPLCIECDIVMPESETDTLGPLREPSEVKANSDKILIPPWQDIKVKETGSLLILLCI